jgi:hypothetical protein
MRLSERSFRILCLVAGGIGFVAIALDGHLYWHEGRLLYAVSHFSISQLIAGEFNPNQLGKAIDIASSSGYHATKVLYLFILKQLTSLPISPDDQLIIGSLVSLLSVVFCGVMLRFVLANLGFQRRVANWSMISFFLVPWAPYLAGKLLSEVTALVPAILSLWCWSKSVREPHSQNILWIVAAGLLLAATALARLDIVVVQIGFAIATALTATRNDASRRLGVNTMVLGIGVAVYLFALYAAGGSLDAISAYFQAYLDLQPKSQLMSAFGLISFGGAVWVFAIAATFGAKNGRSLLLIWLAVTLIPILGIVSNYMVEPRYLTASSLPLAGLAGIGVAALMEKVRSYRGKFLAMAALALVPAANGVPVALMPYEIDRDAILAAADQYAPVGSDATLLASWSYTDFHFLRYARPHSHVLNVCTPVADSFEITSEWNTRLNDWYGWRYVQSPAALSNAVKKGPVYYLGWGVYPPIATAISWAESLHFQALKRKLENLDLLRHREQSWLWESAQYELDFQKSISQYEVYRVQERLQESR